MMGDTPYGVVARKTRPSSVVSLRGRTSHAPADCRACTDDTPVNYILVWGGAREPQSGFQDGEGRGAGWQLVSKAFSQDRFCNVLWSGSSSTPRRRRSFRSSPRTGWVFPAVVLRGAEPRSGRGSGVAVLRRDRTLRDSHGNLDIISMIPVLANTSPRVHASVYGGFGRISRFFFVKANSDPEVSQFQREAVMAVLAAFRGFCSFFAFLQVVWR